MWISYYLYDGEKWNEIPVEGTGQVNRVDVKVIVGVLGGSESITAATMLTQKLHSRQQIHRESKKNKTPNS